MKKMFSLLTLVLGLSWAANAQVEQVKPAEHQHAPAAKIIEDVPPPPPVESQLKFDAIEVNYGTIMQGSEPFRKFTFTNVSNSPAKITNARGSCGCTVPEWPKEEIQPGQPGEIGVRYDTNRVGPFTKTVTITTEKGENIQLRITGKVEAKPAEPEGVPANNNGMFKNNG